MKYVNVDRFILALVEMNPVNAGRFTVFHALKDRYILVLSYPALKEDLLWLIELQEKMMVKLSDLRQPTKKQFSSLLDILDNIIQGLQMAIVSTKVNDQ